MKTDPVGHWLSLYLQSAGWATGFHSQWAQTKAFTGINITGARNLIHK